MKKALTVAIVVLGFATSARALDVEAITAKPTANDPRIRFPTWIRTSFFRMRSYRIK